MLWMLHPWGVSAGYLWAGCSVFQPIVCNGLSYLGLLVMPLYWDVRDHSVYSERQGMCGKDLSRQNLWPSFTLILLSRFPGKKNYCAGAKEIQNKLLFSFHKVCTCVCVCAWSWHIFAFMKKWYTADCGLHKIFKFLLGMTKNICFDRRFEKKVKNRKYSSNFSVLS